MYRRFSVVLASQSRMRLGHRYSSSLLAGTQHPSRKLTDEENASQRFTEWLNNGAMLSTPAQSPISKGPTNDEWRVLVTSALTTFFLHVTARVYALEGRAFYTIGPCGEEFAGVWGCLLNQQDSCALHYRHLASQVARHLKQGRSLEDILLDRARGYVCSSLDPVTGGRHCALGGGPNDFYVTSTLASQAPSAVGRALAGALVPWTPGKKDDSMHFVSLGDGSVANAQFLASKNLAENASFRNIRCPVLFCITDNDISISFKGDGWIDTFTKTFLMPVFKCDGKDITSVWEQSHSAFEAVRKSRKPVALIVSNVNRRFGHAATDRQTAYLTQEEIDERANDNSIIESIVIQAVNNGAMSFKEIGLLWSDIQDKTRAAFEVASKEPKLDSVAMISSANQSNFNTKGSIRTVKSFLTSRPPVQQRATMRKNMTRAIKEQMEARKNMVYLGEDVRHGGYYLVTEGMAQQFGNRIVDFPPDETTLIGCAQGFAQRGLLPVVEIPYLKYLDCGADQFFELAITHWCTNGNQKHGVVLRMQGFDRGVFGGNFHTHNSLYMPPGVDFLIFSNGADWVRGFRAALDAASKGRIVAIIDPTHVLNKRHVIEGDDAWLSEYPKNSGDDNEFRFDDITCYTDSTTSDRRLLLVTYGNGVPDGLIVQEQLRGTALKNKWQIDIVDFPYVSNFSSESLRTLLSESNVEAVLFADPCKPGQNPFSGVIQSMGDTLSGKQWASITAAPTYNPLSRVVTFLSPEAMTNAALGLIKSK